MSVSVEISGLDEALSNLKKLQDDLKLKGDELATRLGQLGVQIASMYYYSAEYAGISDVNVTLDETGELGTATIVASGHAVLFIEFGTGVFFPDDKQPRNELQSSSGLVGRGELGVYGSDPGGWYYPSENGMGANPPYGTEYSDGNQKYIHTLGNPGTPAMYWTRRDLVQSIENIAREVFKL